MRNLLDGEYLLEGNAGKRRPSSKGNGRLTNRLAKR